MLTQRVAGFRKRKNYKVAEALVGFYEMKEKDMTKV